MTTARGPWAVLGAGGLLGGAMVSQLERASLDVRALGRTDVDITDAEAVARAVAGTAVVVNCAGYTDVDGAEGAEDEATRVNGTGAGVVAAAAAAAGAALIHFSTDYVFAGDSSEPYLEDSPLAPINAYGRSKAAGEQAVTAAGGRAFVLRTAWLYGSSGPCFPATIARLLRERGSVEVVDDQLGQPTWARDVADLTIRIVQADVAPGIYHATAGGDATWFEFAAEIARSVGMDDAVAPVGSDRFPRPAARPAYSVLSHAKFVAAGVEPIGDWRDRWRVASPEVLGL